MTDNDGLWQLIQERAILNRLITYCVSVDQLKVDDIVNCFTSDCVFDGGNGRVARGQGEMRSFAAGRLSLYEATSHHLSNFQVVFHGEGQASSSSYVLAFHRLRDSRRIGWLWGRYDDELVNNDGRWLIRSRRLRAADDEGFDPTPGYSTAFERYARG